MHIVVLQCTVWSMTMGTAGMVSVVDFVEGTENNIDRPSTMFSDIIIFTGVTEG